MTSQKKVLTLTTYPLETGMYVETNVFWNIKPCSLMDRFLWNCGRCHTTEEHNINTQCCGSLESHKHMILSDLSNVHNTHFYIQLIERRQYNSDKGLSQTRYNDRTMAVHRKLQENTSLNQQPFCNISSRPRSALRNTMTRGQHQHKCSMQWWTLSKSKTQMQKEN